MHLLIFLYQQILVYFLVANFASLYLALQWITGNFASLSRNGGGGGRISLKVTVQHLYGQLKLNVNNYLSFLLKKRNYIHKIKSRIGWHRELTSIAITKTDRLELLNKTIWNL